MAGTGGSSSVTDQNPGAIRNTYAAWYHLPVSVTDQNPGAIRNVASTGGYNLWSVTDQNPGAIRNVTTQECGQWIECNRSEPGSNPQHKGDNVYEPF